MRFSYKKGFTLLELLVVIAVIGILASVILVAVSGSKTKAQVANIKQQFDSIRSQADVYYANNNDYGTLYANAYYLSVAASASVGGGGSDTGSRIFVSADNCATDYGNGIFMRTATGLGNLIKGICKSGVTDIRAATDAFVATKWALTADGPGTNYFCEDSSDVLLYRTTSAYNVLGGVCH